LEEKSVPPISCSPTTDEPVLSHKPKQQSAKSQERTKPVAVRHDP
jgi:hypothetical protein